MYRLLIVDDNIHDRKHIQEFVDWDLLGIEVVGIACNGREGCDLAVTLQPDIVLTDVAMPLMNGIEMTRAIQQTLDQCAFIFMSCFDEFEYVKTAIKLGVIDYILKPVIPEELTTVLQKVIDRKAEEARTTAHIQRLQNEVRKNLPALQRQQLRNLLFGEKANHNELRKKFAYLNLPDNRDYVVVRLQIDNYQRDYAAMSIEDKYLLIYRIRETVEIQLAPCCTGTVLILDTWNLCAVIFGHFLQLSDPLEAVLDLSNRCRAAINEQIQCSITIGISAISSDFSTVSAAFAAAGMAVKSKIYTNGNRIILASDVIADEVAGGAVYDYNFGELKQELMQLLDGESDQDAEQFLDHYLGLAGFTSSRQGAGEAYAKSLFYSMLNALQSVLHERSQTFGEVFGNEGEIWEMLHSMELLGEIRIWFGELLNRARNYQHRETRSRHAVIADDIRRIIDREYGYLENVGQAAAQIGISTSYASLIFKQETRCTIFEYLISVRMERAKELLKDPYMKVYEIAEAVGYTSTSYFGSVFREYTGHSPKQFRDRYAG